MSRILILAHSGFGKTAGIGEEPKIDIEGLPLDKTFVISVTSKPLTFRGSERKYPVTTLDRIKMGKRIISNNPDTISRALDVLALSPFKYIVLDDTNYIMQDYYMENALRTGWDAPKKIGFDMNKIFKSIEKFSGTDKHIFVMAHGEDVAKPDGRVYTKLKTTGKMVDEYITPEGKFDVVLVGKSRYDSNLKKVVKEYVTNEDEYYCSPKSSVGMFDSLYISNDLGKIAKAVDKFYTTVEEEVQTAPVAELTAVK